jgi:hypothetical protein
MPDKFTSNAERCQHVAELCNIDNLRGDCRPVTFRATRNGVSARLVKREFVDEMLRRLKSSDVPGS